MKSFRQQLRSKLARKTGASRLTLELWEFTGSAMINLFLLLLAVVYLSPLTYMLVSSISPNGQSNDTGAPLYPAERVSLMYEGKPRLVYQVPMEGGIRELALVVPHRESAEFIDPQNIEGGLISWEGSWRALKGVYRFKPTLNNFTLLFERDDFLRSIKNSFTLATISGLGALLSSIAVAYGFSRFRFPGARWLFFLMIATIMIPDSITLVPTYFIFARTLDWFGTWYPLFVPAFFANAVLVFLLRQNFKSIPRDLDEAAMIDGANPLQILFWIIIPQSAPVIVTVALLHFFYIWNETRLASLYLGVAPDLQPVSFMLSSTTSTGYAGTTGVEILQAATLVIILVPALLLLVAQRFFMHDMIVTGMEK